MRPIALAAFSLLAPTFAALAAQAVEQGAASAARAAFAPRQAPPLPAPGPLAEPRASAHTGLPAALTAQVTPPGSLRNVLVTGRYFHDGSMQTLWDVLDHYNKGDGITDPWLDQDMQPLALTEAEIDDLVAFLASLTSSQ